MSEDYKRLLDKALSKLPSKTLKKGRFVLPKPVSSVSGNRTILINFKDICDRLRRDQDHFMKFLSGELATSGMTDGIHAIFQGNFSGKVIERLVSRYAHDFVLCPVCDQPDTRIVKEGRFFFLKCEACGARSSLRGI